MQQRVYNVYELFFRKNGEKLSMICNSKRELQKRKGDLLRNKRKYLGSRPVKLVEYSGQ